VKVPATSAVAESLSIAETPVAKTSASREMSAWPRAARRSPASLSNDTANLGVMTS
jgi:hypothetical protein